MTIITTTKVVNRKSNSIVFAMRIKMRLNKLQYGFKLIIFLFSKAIKNNKKKSTFISF